VLFKINFFTKSQVMSSIIDQLDEINCPLCGNPHLKLPAGKLGECECPDCHLLLPFYAGFHTDVKQLPQAPEIAGYELTRLLGNGGMGSVYEARQLSLNNRKVAVKVLNEDIVEAEYLAAEVEALVKLSHPAIVTIFDLVKCADGRSALVMELIVGHQAAPLSFRDVFNHNRERQSVLAATSSIYRISRAISYAHGQGVLHLDLKPENILIDHLGELRIVDFGLARHYRKEDGNQLRKTMFVEVYGTPAYMAPERRLEGTEPNAKQDIYSLGAIFYEMLTGVLPEGHFEMPSDVNPEIPEFADLIIKKSLNSHPEKRYADVHEMERDLDDMLNLVKIQARDKKKIRIKGWDKNETIGVAAEQEEAVKIPVSASIPVPVENGKNKEDKSFYWLLAILAGIFIVLSFVGVGAVLLLINALAKTPEKNIAKIEAPAKTEKNVQEAVVTIKPTIAVNNRAGLSGREQYEQGLKLLSEKKDRRRNYHKAVELFRQAVKLGDTRAEYELGRCYYYGYGVTADSSQALKLFMQAAEKGNPRAQNRIGEFYFYGDEMLVRNPEKALGWFEKAAVADDAKAQFNLGECYYYGEGAKVNKKRAVDLFMMAAEKGNAHAQYALGKCFLRGDGTSEDRQKAMDWFEKSAVQGYAPAKEILTELKKQIMSSSPVN
jgi:serine/threonine protein kinase